MEYFFNSSYGAIHYKIINEKSSGCTLLFLHGWGQSMDTFNNVTKLINYKIVLIDFLGFGKSNLLKIPMSLTDYAISIKELLLFLEIRNVIIIGHSFGGRVAIRLSKIEDKEFAINKIFLVSSKAFISKSFNFRLKIIKYKFKKLFNYVFNRRKYYEIIKNSGSQDYKNASVIMKDTIKKIVNDDLTQDLIKINCDVIVMGSINDDTVLYQETLKIYQLVKKGKLYPFYCSNHFCYITEEKKFINILKKEI